MREMPLRSDRRFSYRRSSLPPDRRFSYRRSSLPPGRRFSYRRSSTAAFTLVELIVTSALTAMILVAAYLCLQSALTSQKLIHSRSDAAQAARAALALMTADLRAACPLSADFAFLGLRRTIDDADADNLDFATLNYTPARPGESDICDVSYFLGRNPDTGSFSLWRRRDAVPDGDPLAGGSRQEIAENVRGLRFEYSDGFSWYESWGEAEGEANPDSLLTPANLIGMPEIVRITLLMESEPFRPGAAEKPAGEREPPLVFQAEARLNLATTPWTHPTITSDQQAPGGLPQL